ncbi:hypothetical protein B0H19DRAFT_152161 [Mycena capillaripes]|nr:hypothetical protein B0H19DRAFT_152161 [Mycena capillaripes]
MGVGFEAAKHFAEMNIGRLILACRNVDAGDLAVKQIVEVTRCSTVTCWPLAFGPRILCFSPRVRKPTLIFLSEMRQL